MEAYALSKYNRMSAFKVRRILTLIRKQNFKEAMEMLKYMPGASAPKVMKTLKSAASNLKQKVAGIGDDEIYVTVAVADEGPTIKRIKPRAQGRATLVRKRTCHIKISVTNDLEVIK